MNSKIHPSVSDQVRVLYSFAYRIGAGRICKTAWQQVDGASRAGAKVTVMCGAIEKRVPGASKMITTLGIGRYAIPYRLLGRRRVCDLHDWRTAKWLERHHREIDIVHGWPLSSLRTIRTAKKHGIPCVLERPNAHTAFAYEVVADESRRIGVELPGQHDHKHNQENLDWEEAEFQEADFLLCPSEFVMRTFADRGYPSGKLLRHQYGFDVDRFAEKKNSERGGKGIVALYAGACEPRKGLHFALEAWLGSGAQEAGKFLVCGSFVEGYREYLEPLLSHPSIEVLGHRDDLPDLMRKSDLFVLSSLEEGSALVTYEARGAGCVLLVSDATGAHCTHEVDALVHEAGDADQLCDHLRLLDEDRGRLEELRSASRQTSGQLTWEHAGRRLATLYENAAGDRA